MIRVRRKFACFQPKVFTTKSNFGLTQKTTQSGHVTDNEMIRNSPIASITIVIEFFFHSWENWSKRNDEICARSPHCSVWIFPWLIYRFKSWERVPTPTKFGRVISFCLHCFRFKCANWIARTDAKRPRTSANWNSEKNVNWMISKWRTAPSFA